MSDNKKVSSELQGVSRLITDATIGIVDIVEAMHRRVVHPPFMPSTLIQHLITQIAGITYTNIRWSAKIIGGVLDKSFGQLSSLLGTVATSDDRETIRSILNGVVGDYLELQDNPLKIQMQYRYLGKSITLEAKSLIETYTNINGKILLMVHGSCMNDIQWTFKEHNHGINLANEQQKTPLFLHYNSGLHISTNGKYLNILLQELVENWPVPIEEIEIIAHSMGGLVSRSAVHYGQDHNMSWTKYLKSIVLLGTPNHGATLERLGNYLDVALQSIPYTKPFARLGKIRSAGLTDLRYGNILDEDWKDHDRFRLQGDPRSHVPLPGQINAFSIAGLSRKDSKTSLSRWSGDKLVSVKSALGQHRDPQRNLGFKKENTWIAEGVTHMGLLRSPSVYAKIKEWLN